MMKGKFTPTKCRRMMCLRNIWMKRSGKSTFPDCGSFSRFELVDLDRSFRELRGDLQLPTHGSDKVLQSADVHIRAAFHLRNGSLIDLENPGQMNLSHLTGLAQFIQGHFSPVFRCQGT